ncbi:MAG: hypothetical protein LBC67_06360, partial [Spirochaetales bacterium]|nr:hypothetical protein [Spirochaetales bacterium]
MKKVLLVPSVKKGGGTGHIRRCIRLLLSLGDEARILAPKEGGADRWSAAEIIERFAPDLGEGRFAADSSGEWDFLVFDRRETRRDEFFRIAGPRPALGLDEGGQARPLFTCLVDTFPRLLKGLEPNIAEEGFIAEGCPKPLSPPRAIRRVLLSFGGEDPSGLTELTLEALLRQGLKAGDIGLVIGPAFSGPLPGHSGPVYPGLENIRPLFAAYDCVFTSFGITPYEALKEGRFPVLVNPSAYHEKLSRKAGFYSLGTGAVSRAKLKNLLAGPEACLKRTAEKFSPRTETAAPPASPPQALSYGEDLKAFVLNFSPPASARCPACTERLRRPVFRNAEASFFLCP